MARPNTELIYEKYLYIILNVFLLILMIIVGDFMYYLELLVLELLNKDSLQMIVKHHDQISLILKILRCQIPVCSASKKTIVTF